MSDISVFDFNNEGDCILANDNIKPHDNVSSHNDSTFTFMDLMLLSACSDILFHDVEMTEQQMSQLKRHFDIVKPNVRPVVDCVDLNDSDSDLVNEIAPRPAVVIGIEGDF